MMRIKNVFLAACLLLLVGACESVVQDDAPQVLKETKVRFSSVVEGDVVTRATGTTWETNDRIGVFMKKTGAALEAGNIVNNADNKPFVTPTGNGYFSPEGTSLLYPTDGSSVDFIAYYPYIANEQTPYIYKVDVTNQSKPAAIDLLYADNLTNRNQESPMGNLQFYHRLAKLIVNFTTTDGTDLTNLTASLKGGKTRADFSLADGTLTVDDASGATVQMLRVGNAAEAIVLPAASTASIKLQLSLNGKNLEVSLPANITKLEGGSKYVCSVTVKGGGTSAYPDEAQNYRKMREMPLITNAMLANPAIQTIDHDMGEPTRSGDVVRNYSILYDSDLKIAYWVAYPLCDYYLGDQKRTDAWGYDPRISSSLQVNVSKSYNGYDRGHQLPSADRTRDRSSNVSTFYSTNMTPQIGPKMNQSIWQELESRVRSWVTDTIFVVTGAAPTAVKGAGVTWHSSDVKWLTHSGKQIAVPKYYYKALARKVQNNWQTIAFKIENKDYPDRNFMQYALSVSDLEKETGFIFFPKIDNSIKSKLDTSQWK